MSILSDFETAKDIEGLKKVRGVITHLAPKEDDKGKRYGVRIDSMNAIWFNGWGTCQGEIGDTIEFTYVVANAGDKTFYNIKEVLKVDRSNIIKECKDKLVDLSGNPKIINLQTRALLISKAVELCIKRNELDDERITESYERLCELIGFQLNNGVNEETPKEKK